MKVNKVVKEKQNIKEDNYRVLFESSRDSITLFSIDSDGNFGNFIDANPATTSLLGFSQKELLSMNISNIEIVSEQDKKSRIEILLAKKKVNFEAIIKDKNGNHRNIEINAIIIDYNGKPTVMNICRDVTLNKQIEENTRKTQENFSTILDAIPDLLFEVGYDGMIYYYQSHRKDLLALPPEAIIGKKFQTILPSEVSQICFEALEEASQNGWSLGKKYFLNLPTGKHWFEISTSLVKESSPQDKRFIFLARDITQRKLAEEALQENKENLQSIFDSVSEAIYVLDENGTFIDVNKGAEKMYNYSKEELIGKNPQAVAAPELNDLEEVEKIMQSVFENGIPILLEFWAVRKNGEIFPKDVVVNRGKRLGKNVLIITARDISERKKTEIELKKSQDKLKNVFNLANSGIVLADLEGNFLEFNNWWPKMTGYTEEEFSQMKNFSLAHPDELEISKKWHERLINGKIDKYQLEKKYIRKDKSIFWGESSVSAIKDKNNKIVSTIGIVTDITERKLTEESLRESEEKYRGLVENSPDGIITYVDDKISYANAEALRIVGANHTEQVLGKSVLEFIHPDSLESIIQRMIEVTRDKHASMIVEEKLLSLTGELIYAELKAIPTLFEQQNAIQVIIHDITERKHDQYKIRQLSQAVEQSPVAIVITNTKGIIEYVNPKFIETTGYALEEILGNNPRILKSDYTSANDYKNLWKTISSGKEWFGEFHNKKKDGSLYWELASISPISTEQGKITHYIAIKEDITERKNIEKQLIEAKEKAEESDRLKLAFLANMSHEIRTPMNGILGFTELLKAKNLSGNTQKEYINIIEKSGKRMLNIINDIINISKIESGQIEINISETDVNEQIEYLQTFFKPETQHKNIELLLTKKLNTKDTFIKTDREKLYAVLTNLIKNAIKFTNEGAIEFGCERKGDFLEFFVKDSGIGISKSQKKIIFERFRQANESVSRTHEGSGLGLAISKAYVEMQGGTIWVESTKGEGSTFYFTIPFHSEYNEKVTIKKEKLLTKKEEINDLKVLIVEDDPISKLLITIALKPFSKKIIKVSTGIEAIEYCRKNPDIDLVMMDINMPEMGGYEATNEIRKFNKDLVIIAQTANGLQNDHDKAIEAGCTDYISKPINIASLSKLICKYFKK